MLWTIVIIVGLVWVLRKQERADQGYEQGPEPGRGHDREVARGEISDVVR